MNPRSASLESYEISPRFRQSMEERIGRLERDAAADESMLAHLKCEDHIRRHRRLVTVQRAEALRMRLFLERARPRLPRPLIAL
jgi:ribosome-associated translation inhibitor RaiA